MTHWLKIAESELGVHELPGEAAHPVILQWFADCGHPEIKSDEVPNCAAAIGSWLKRAGIAGTGKLNAKSYLDWGTPLQTPVLGCIAVFDRPPDPASGHVALFKRDLGDAIEVHGANQADCVSVTRFPKARVVGYRWPSGYPMPDIVKEVAATSSKFSLATWLQRILAPSGIGLGLVSQPDLTQSVGALASLANTVKGAGVNGPLALCLAFCAFVILLEVFKAKTVGDAAAGRYTPSGDVRSKVPEKS